MIEQKGEGENKGQWKKDKREGRVKERGVIREREKISCFYSQVILNFSGNLISTKQPVNDWRILFASIRIAKIALKPGEEVFASFLTILDKSLLIPNVEIGSK